MTERRFSSSKVIVGRGGPTSAGWHSVEQFLRCPKAYQFGKVRGIRQPLEQTPDHFAVGLLHHAQRARWFALKFATSAKAMASVQDAMFEECEKQQLTISTDAQQRARVLFDAYIKHWSKRPRPTPVAAEYLVGPAPLVPGDPEYLWRTARLDDVSIYPEAGGRLCLGESKTTGDSIGDCITQYTLHGQPLLQLLLWKMSPRGEAMHGPAAGVMLDICKKQSGRNPPKFERCFVPVKDSVLEWYAPSLRGYIAAAMAVGWDTEAPRNTQGCTYKAGRMRAVCDFRDLCMHGKDGAGKYVLSDGTALRKFEPEPGKTRMPWE